MKKKKEREKEGLTKRQNDKKTERIIMPAFLWSKYFVRIMA